jgi:hypothetical protein
MELVRLALENVADLLDEKLQRINIDFWKYPDPDLYKFSELREKGKSTQTWFFRIKLRDKSTLVEENFVFNFFRSGFYGRRPIIPLVANRLNEAGEYAWIDTPKIRLREIFVDEHNILNVRMCSSGAEGFSTSTKVTNDHAAQEFFDDVLKECFGLRN